MKMAKSMFLGRKGGWKRGDGLSNTGIELNITTARVCRTSVCEDLSSDTPKAKISSIYSLCVCLVHQVK